jgi:hypothetical protein
MDDRYRATIIALSGLAMIALAAQPRAAGNEATSAPPAQELSADAKAFLALVETYRGKVFCAPPGATIGDAATVVKRYVAQHPELGGRYSDQQVLTALADAYPCTVRRVEHRGRAPDADPVPRSLDRDRRAESPTVPLRIVPGGG